MSAAVIRSRTVVLRERNIDTDQIIPARFLTTTERAGIGRHAFSDWRSLADGSPDPDFPFNRPENAGAQVLVAGRNFGCGSSREHAPLAIKACGVSCVIAKTFARIFYRNAIDIGLAILECEAACDKIESGDSIEINFDSGVITNHTKGETYQAQPFPPFIKDIISKGGLLQSKKRGI